MVACSGSACFANLDTYQDIRDRYNTKVDKAVEEPEMTYSPEYQREYYRKNKERIRARNDEWAKENPEKVKEYARKTALKRTDVQKQAIRDWEVKNPERVLLRVARNRARRDGLEFSLTLEDVVIPEFCPLLGLRIEARRGGHGPKDQSPSLDRLDNQQGYVKGNVWVISWLANKMKATASREQLLTFAGNVQKIFAAPDGG